MKRRCSKVDQILMLLMASDLNCGDFTGDYFPPTCTDCGCQTEDRDWVAVEGGP
jgi:hypothetical protein